VIYNIDTLYSRGNEHLKKLFYFSLFYFPVSLSPSFPPSFPPARCPSHPLSPSLQLVSSTWRNSSPADPRQLLVTGAWGAHSSAHRAILGRLRAALMQPLTLSPHLHGTEWVGRERSWILETRCRLAKHPLQIFLTQLILIIIRE
jgi:hypothetical protein